jgi:hypothetical protein
LHPILVREDLAHWFTTEDMAENGRVDRSCSHILYLSFSLLMENTIFFLSWRFFNEHAYPLSGVIWKEITSFSFTRSMHRAVRL